MAYDYDDETTDQPTGKGLRAQLEAALAAKAELEQRVAQRDDEFKALSEKVRKSEVAEILGGLGVSKRISRYVLADVQDVSENAVREWIENNGEDFGVSLSRPDSGAQQPPVPEAGQPGPDQAALDSLARLQRIDQGGATSPDKEAAEIQKLAQLNEQATSYEEFKRLLLQNGA